MLNREKAQILTDQYFTVENVLCSMTAVPSCTETKAKKTPKHNNRPICPEWAYCCWVSYGKERVLIRKGSKYFMIYISALYFLKIIPVVFPHIYLK